MTHDRTAVAQSVARACTEGAGTVQALADEVGVSYAALCSWSRGRRKPPAHRLRKLADVLDSRAERLQELAEELRTQAGDESTAGADARNRASAGAAGDGNGRSAAPHYGAATATPAAPRPANARPWLNLGADSPRSRRERSGSAPALPQAAAPAT